MSLIGVRPCCGSPINLPHYERCDQRDSLTPPPPPADLAAGLRAIIHETLGFDKDEPGIDRTITRLVAFVGERMARLQGLLADTEERAAAYARQTGEWLRQMREALAQAEAQLEDARCARDESGTVGYDVAGTIRRLSSDLAQAEERRDRCEYCHAEKGAAHSPLDDSGVECPVRRLAQAEERIERMRAMFRENARHLDDLSAHAFAAHGNDAMLYNRLKDIAAELQREGCRCSTT